MSPARPAADPTSHSTRAAGPGAVVSAAVAFGPLLLAAALTSIVAGLDGAPFEDVVLLPPGGLGPGRFTVALAAMIAGYFGVYAAPGILWARALRLRPANWTAFALTAFVLSLAGASLAWIAAMAVTDGVAGRVCLYLTVAVLDAAALLVGVFRAPGASAWPPVPGDVKRELLVPLGGALLVLAAAWALMPGKITTEALEGDATEVHGFAASLYEHALPEWDLETGVWGFYPTFAYVAYPVFFSLAIGGDSEAAVRLPALLFLAVLVLTAADLAGRGRARAAGGTPAVLLPVMLVGYLSLQVGAYYAGYHPVHGDLGCSPLEEWAVTGLAMCAFVLLRDGAVVTSAVAALLSILTFPSGLMVVGLVGVGGLVSGGGERRRAVIRWGFVLAGMIALYALFLVIYTRANGTFGPMIGEWYEKYFARRGNFASESPLRMVRALGWYTLLAGGLPVAGYALAWRAGRTARWMALSGGIWVLFFLLSPDKNIHYFLPAAFLPLAVTLRVFAGGGEGRLRTAGSLMAASVLTCILLSRPAVQPPYTADRDFGRRTVFLAGSEREAVQYARVLYNLVHPLQRWMPGGTWTVGVHTWVMYADRGYELDRDYDFYVGQGPPPVDGLTEVSRIRLAGGGTAKLWSPGGRAAFREWKERTFPAKRDQSRFNFEMPAPATK